MNLLCFVLVEFITEVRIYLSLLLPLGQQAVCQDHSYSIVAWKLRNTVHECYLETSPNPKYSFIF